MTAVWFVLGAMVLFALTMTRRASGERKLRLREQAMREEFAAYAQLDTGQFREGGSETRMLLARRICAAVARHNPCHQAALLLRDAEQRLKVTGSAGVDDLLQRALDEWGERFMRDRRGTAAGAGERLRRSYTVTLGPMENFDTTRRFGALGCRQVMMLPLWSESGVMLGALAAAPAMGERVDLEQALPPLEALAETLARSLENAAMAGRLLRAEKIAGLGQLARGVAHELNNPLTTVLGFAELIAETAEEPRVREDAEAIVSQAVRMQETVASLLEFWRPVNQADAQVNVNDVLKGAAEECKQELQRRGITLSVEGGATEACVRGHGERLRQLFEHLLNNAAQAVGRYAAHEGELRAIRITVASEASMLQVVVSDTGAGFAEPSRVFDPFYTTGFGTAMASTDERGMGLAVSYGIVREHGGEISAFNLHPHGAAVVVELPLAAVMEESGKHAIAA